jgi:hypothetical protein
MRDTEPKVGLYAEITRFTQPGISLKSVRKARKWDFLGPVPPMERLRRQKTRRTERRPAGFSA